MLLIFWTPTQPGSFISYARNHKQKLSNADKRQNFWLTPWHLRKIPFMDFCVCVFSRSIVSVTPWTVPRQASLSMGILQAKILELTAMSSSRGSSQPRDQTKVSRIAGGCITTWDTREIRHLWEMGLPVFKLRFPKGTWGKPFIYQFQIEILSQ